MFTLTTLPYMSLAPQEVASTITRASVELVESLEKELSMRVSRRDSWQSYGAGKTVLATSARVVARIVATSMRRLGIQAKTKASHSGVPFWLGGKTRPPL